MMRECFDYSCKWRYEYNPAKCAVIVFNETKRHYAQSQREWKIGPHVIKEPTGTRTSARFVISMAIYLVLLQNRVIN